MMIPATALALVTQLMTIADNVPRFNLEPVCHGIAEQGGLDLEPGRSARQDFTTCMTSEMAMRDQLVKQWSRFKASDKANCIGEASAGGLSSYTDLMTCLQMAKDVNGLGQ